MALRARKPEAVQKRLKLFMFGPAGVGKTTAAIQFPNAYIIDCERGTENYEKTIAGAGSVVYQTVDVFDVITEVKGLLTERHEFRTLVIDPITPIYNDLLEKSEGKVGSDFGRHYGEANKVMKRLANLIMALDMNVIITAHAKTEYGENLKKLGYTFDGWRQLDYWFDLVIELGKRGKKRVGKVVKTRIETFPDEDVFEWSYDAMRSRYDAATLERPAGLIPLATREQVAEVVALLNVVRLPEGLVDKWFGRANVDQWEDMSAEAIGKCIEYIRSRFPSAADSVSHDGRARGGNGNSSRGAAPPPPPPPAPPPPPPARPALAASPAVAPWAGPVPGDAAFGGRDYRSNSVFVRDWSHTCAARLGIDNLAALTLLGQLGREHGKTGLDDTDNDYRNSLIHLLETGALDDKAAPGFTPPPLAGTAPPAEPAAAPANQVEQVLAGAAEPADLWASWRDEWDGAAADAGWSPTQAGAVLLKRLERVGRQNNPESTTAGWRAESLAALREGRLNPETGALIADTAPAPTSPPPEPPPNEKRTGERRGGKSKQTG